MKVMVVGGGGREHAIVKSLKKNAGITELYCLPGNGGIAADAVCVPIGAKDTDGIVRFAVENGIDYAVVAPDDPLVLGTVDRLNAAGIPCFGPTAAAARIEGSKIFSKQLMKKYGIPTAEFRVFTDPGDAIEYVAACPLPTVIKADGLALGKGVIIAKTREEAETAVREMMISGRFGESGRQILIEQCLTGPEVSVLAFTDGVTVCPMISSMDHKRAHDGNEGPNTGGMGTVAPNPYYTDSVADECMKTIFLPTVRAMAAEGCPFKGCLYFGLMLTPDGPKVIEYNCRFGDPETQVVLPLLENDLLTIMLAVTDGTLDANRPVFSNKHACCVIEASDGYPGKYASGFPVKSEPYPGTEIFYAGVKLTDGGELVTSGGRVLGITAVADSLAEAVKTAYAAAGKTGFENAYYRKDIGAEALKAVR